MEIIIEGSTVYNGDCLEVMETIDKCSVDSIVTDPPYHLTSIVERFGKEGSAPAQFGTDGAFARASKGFMGKEWDGGDIAFQANTWRKCYELLKPGGHLIAFSGSRTYHRMAVAIEDAGFEIRDQCIWLYGSGFPKSLNIGKEVDKKMGNERKSMGMYDPRGLQDGANRIERGIGGQQVASYDSSLVEKTKGNTEWEGWGTALKPAHEPMVLARKPLSEKSVSDNVMKHGTGAINIDASRIEGEVKHPDTMPDFRDQGEQSKAAIGVDKLSFGQTSNAKRKKVVRKPRSADGVWSDDNSGMKSEGSEFADADPRGRWPSNIMHDGSEQVQQIFPTTSSTEVSRQRTHKGIWSDNKDDDGDYMPAYGDHGNASRYFYCAKTSKDERNFGLGGKKASQYSSDGRTKEIENAYQRNKSVSANTHPTVKPVELMRYLVRLVTPKGGLVLDPFMGSGSTGMAAREEDFRFIGIEKEEEYYEIAKARIKNVKPQLKLFDI
jgi:site-specific DNA-methyltransferase (adenine-specific)